MRHNLSLWLSFAEYTKRVHNIFNATIHQQFIPSHYGALCLNAVYVNHHMTNHFIWSNYINGFSQCPEFFLSISFLLNHLWMRMDGQVFSPVFLFSRPVLIHLWYSWLSIACYERAETLSERDFAKWLQFCSAVGNAHAWNFPVIYYTEHWHSN